MEEGFGGIITALQQRKTAIENALAALREIVDVPAPAQVTPVAKATVETSGRKYKISAEARERMSQGQRKRYAHLHTLAAPATPASTAPEAPEPKRKISPEGLKRIIAATKKRWRLKRATDKAALEQAEANKAARKKTAALAKAVKKSI